MSGDEHIVGRDFSPAGRNGFNPAGERAAGRAVPSLGQLAWLVARDVNRTIGGGIASMELMRRSLARHRWLDDHEHGVLVAVGRFTPGTNLLAYCAALGWTCQRSAGAIVAVAAGSLPGAAAVSAMAAAVGAVDGLPAVRVVLGGAMLIASGLMLAGGWALVRPHVTTRRAWTVMVALVSAALSAAGATPVRVLLALAILGALTPRKDPA